MARKARNVPALPPFEPCGCCVSGWIDVNDDRGKYARRCICWQIHQERIRGILSGAISAPTEPEDR